MPVGLLHTSFLKIINSIIFIFDINQNSTFLLFTFDILVPNILLNNFKRRTENLWWNNRIKFSLPYEKWMSGKHHQKCPDMSKLSGKCTGMWKNVCPEIVPKHERSGHYQNNFQTIQNPFFIGMVMQYIENSNMSQYLKSNYN